MKNNKILILLIVLYSVAIISVIFWGIPNETRPFNCNMDEWHQMSAVRALFAQGTPNVPGAAHGSIFQFFLSGIYLIPFTILNFIDPFAIHSSIDNLRMQEKLFVVLRTNTLLFGILSIIVLAVISKRYLNINSALATLLFVGTPIWLTFSSYFKYDIALIFWILLSILAILNYAKAPTLKKFIISALPCSLALATKVSAIPMLIVYIFSFFWFTPHWQKKYNILILGLIVFLEIFTVFGIPDLIFRWGDYMEYLSSNLLASVKNDSNYLLGVSNKWIYIFFVGFPMIFGRIFYVIFIISFVFWFVRITKWFYAKEHSGHRSEIFLFFSSILFLLSLIPLGLGSLGNRSLVLLPFFGLLSAKFLTEIVKLNKYKIYLIVFISALILVQFTESSVVISAKYKKSVLRESSEWIVKNIPKNARIGIENIPIYQSLPDIVLKEYYLGTAGKNAKTKYRHEVVSASSNNLPKVVIITNKSLYEKYLVKSAKKDLLERLKKENYRVVGQFIPDSNLYRLFNNDLDYYLSGLNFVFPVTIYERS